MKYFLSILLLTSAMALHAEVTPIDSVSVEAVEVDSNIAELRHIGWYAMSLHDSLVHIAQSHLGIPYCYGGKSLNCFDCSGFVSYVYESLHIPMEHGSSAQSKVGRKVNLKKAHKGDLIFFTRGNPGNKKIGHVGLIVSEEGTPIEFIHSPGRSRSGVRVEFLDEAEWHKQRVVAIRRVID